MINKIYIFEDRSLAYLDKYVSRATGLGLQIHMVSGKELENNHLFSRFKDVYDHHSVNPYSFELTCFARYFAIASALTNNDAFILSDSDIYITPRLKDTLGAYSLNGSFVGSEGFISSGSERQISPHFSFWNRDLINDFTNFLVEIYTENKGSSFFADLYKEQQAILGKTGISDMTLLYLWIKRRNIPFINSNSTKFDFGIDHNLSVLRSEESFYKSFLGRKKLIIEKEEIKFELISGKTELMSVVHFQGGYKRILSDFYSGEFMKFNLFTAYICYGRLINKIIKK